MASDMPSSLFLCQYTDVLIHYDVAFVYQLELVWELSSQFLILYGRQPAFLV